MPRAFVLRLCTAFLLLSAAQAPAQEIPDQLPALPGDAELATIGTARLVLADLPQQARAEVAELDRRYRQQLRLLYLNYSRAQQDLLEKAATGLVEERLLQREAGARGVTEDKLRERLSVPDPTAAAIQSFYQAHQAQLGQPLEKTAPAIATRLKRDATEQAHWEFFNALEHKYAARVTLTPLRDAVDASGPARGPANAGVTMVEFADFQCPYCQQMEAVLKRVLEHYPRQVRLVFRHMPLTDLHPNAFSAAAAGFCANDQGEFWEMHDAMFADQGALGSDALVRKAESLHLDGNTFRACLQSDRTRAAIKADYDAAVTAGVGGTPGLFVNGRYLNGAVSYARLAAMIDDELRRAAPSARSDVRAAALPGK